MDINLKDPKTNDWLHFGEVKMSDQVFTYTKQWEWDQYIRIIPWDGWDEIKFKIESDRLAATVDNEKTSNNEKTSDGNKTSRTVITAVPKTWPSGSLIWIIVATLAIFGGYIYIKKRADI